MTVVNDYSHLVLADRTVTAYAAPTIVPIRTTGTKAPVFCIHPIEGLTGCYSDLIEHVDEDRPVYGVQAIGDRPASLTALAGRYADEILTVQPAGPVHLVGTAFGGLLAHAIAVDLRGRGVDVGALVLVASEPLRRPADLQRDLLAKMSDVIDRSRAEELLAVAAHNETLAGRHFPGVYTGDVVVISDTEGASAWHPFVSGNLSKYLVPDASAFGLVGPLINRFF